MELFDMQEYARARQRETLRSFRFAERAGLTRDGRAPGNAASRRDRTQYGFAWQQDFEG